MSPTHPASVFTAAVAAAAIIFPVMTEARSPLPAGPDRSVVEEGQRLFYNGRYEAAVALVLPLCTTAPLDWSRAGRVSTSVSGWRLQIAEPPVLPIGCSMRWG